MKLARITAFCIALLMAFSLQGWSQSSPAEAFENVTIHTADGNTIEGGTIVWRNGIITHMGKDVSIPFDAYVRDGGDSLHVYPGFIDGMAYWGSPDQDNNIETPDEPGNPSYARAGIKTNRHSADHLNAGDDALAEAPKHGFTTAALGIEGQMLPGQIDFFFVQGADTKDNVIESGKGMLAQFESARGQAYPSTTMGVMSQFRQLFHDAKALQQQEQYFASVSSNYPAPAQNKTLEALYPIMDQEQPFFFIADSKENIERMFWLQDELGFDVVLVSGEEAYTKADELVERNIPVLASIDFPDEPEWRQEKEEKKKKQKKLTDEQKNFRDRQLKAYQADIRNINKLIEAGVQVGYASNGLDLSDVKESLKTLSEDGQLTEEQILQMLTQNTANILGYGQRLGDLQEGRLANFTVFTEPFMNEDTQSLYSVSDGMIMEFESEFSN
jgi:hypothetical protein